MPKFRPERGAGQVLSESCPAPGSGVPFEAAADGTFARLRVRYESSWPQGGPRLTAGLEGRGGGGGASST